MDMSQASWFSILAGLGAGIGLLWSWVKIGEDPRRIPGRSVEVRRDSLVPAALLVLLGGALGARISFVLLHGIYYQVHPAEVICIWEGGLDWVGAPVGVLITVLIYAGWKGIMPLAILEDLIPIWTTLTTALWLSCGYAGLYTVNGLQLGWFGAVLTVLFDLGLDWFLKKRKSRAPRFGVIFALQMGMIFAFAFIRTDVVAPIAGLPSDRLAAGAYLVGGIAVVVASTTRRKTSFSN